MHVSLPRRSHRVGLSMQYLLWFCFGLLAVVPWQVIRGQDEPAKPRSKPASKTRSETSQTTANEGTKSPSKSKSKLLTQSSSQSLIFRSQTAAPQAEVDPLTASPPEDQGFMADQRLTGRSGQAYGAQMQASAFTGPGIGRKHQILPLQMMPYAFVDNNLFFADLRGFTDAVNGFGANVGGGYRRYLPRFDRILGVNGYYDYDNTSGALFRELGFGVESLGALYDVRANAYFPTGQQSQQLSLTNVNGTQKFVGHLLQVDQAKVVANALHGFDSEIGVPLPGRIGKRHDMRVFGGGYWFEGTEIASFGGWKARIQGNIIPSVAAQLQVSNDQQFKTNVVFGVTWTFGGYQQGDDERKTQYDRMTTPVLRQYNMVVGLTTQSIKGVTVVDPATGNPYFFEHVASYATGPTFDGTVEHPFITVADAQAVDSPGNIIFVHGNSTYNGVALALQDNVRVLGEATNVEHTVQTAGGPLLLPHPTAAPAVRPIFANSPGDGVVLANNSEFSGFQIGNAAVAGSGPAGIGIFGFQVSNVEVRQTDVSFSVGEGVNLTQTSGTITFQGDVINSPASNATAFHVNGTTAGGTVIFESDPLVPAGQQNPTASVINNAGGGFALVVENTVAGSVVNFANGTVNDNAGLGILFSNDAGSVSLGDANLTGELANGLNILNDNGQIIGNGNLTIAGSVLDAMNIQNLGARGQVSFLPTAAINISGRQARGINLEDNAGNVALLSPILISSVGNVALPGIEYQGSTGNAVFGNITIANGGRGIVVDPDALAVPDSGLFTIRGTTTLNGPLSDGITVTNVDSIVSINTLNITNRGRIGVEILDTRSPVSFTGLSTITNTTVNSNFPGLDVRGNGAQASVSFQSLTVNGAIGPAAPGFTGVGVNIGGALAADANPGQVSFSNLVVNQATGGTALFADNVGITTTLPPTGGLIINAGAISAIRGTAVDIENSALSAKLTSVSSSNAPGNGITLLNNTPFNNTLASALATYAFTVTGNAGGRGTGGTIQQAGGVGVSVINSGGVSLSDMLINNNPQGVVASNTLRLTMINDGLNTNVGNGVFGTNVAEVDISGSTFNNNAANGGNAIHLTANALLPLISPTGGSYLWNITNNSALNGFAGSIITPLTGGDAVLIDNNGRLQDPVSGLTTPLVLTYSNNTVFMNGVGAALNDSWTGPEHGSMNLNNLTLTGQNTGFFIQNNDLNFLTNFNILGNTLNATGGGNTGILVNNLGPTDLFIGSISQVVGGVNVITRNNFTFTQVGGNAVINTPNVAMQFTTGANSDIDIFSNTVNMTGGAGVSDSFLIFRFQQSPTTITISDNIVTMQNEAVAPGQGVDFLASTGALNLNGALNNTISINGLANQAGPNWVFKNPGIVTIGTFPVNGFFVP